MNNVDFMPDFWEDLMDEEPSESFTITDDSMAEWAMQKIAEARADTAKWTEHFAAQLDRIRKDNEQTEAFFSAALARFFESVPHRKSATQEKYVLPGGELLRKKQQPEYIRDDSVLVPFLLENGMSDFVKNKPSADWAAIKKTCTIMEDGTVVDKESGLVLEGVTAEARPDKFEVKING